MKILVFTKRYTSAKDLSREGVGRPYRLFAALREYGHEVSFLLGDYTDRERRDVVNDGVEFAIRPLSPTRLLSFGGVVERALRAGRHDLLIAEGDPIFAFLARGPCRKMKVPLVYDLMDNYETYAVYRYPFVRRIDRRSIREADLVVCVTSALRDRIAAIRREGVSVVGNGVDLDKFSPMDGAVCRERFGIPPGARVAGYFGYIVDYKGIGQLLRAREILRRNGFPLTLLLAGNRDPGVSLEGEGLIYRGLVPFADIPGYINACDCVVVPNPSNSYTDYSFPLKIGEAMACGVPVVATDLGPVREILGEDYPWLPRAGDAGALADAIRGACEGPRVDLRTRAAELSWVKQAGRLDREIRALSRAT